MVSRPRAVAPGSDAESRLVTDDAADRVRGTFRFSVDRRVDGCAFARAVRSLVPHGQITRIDASDALVVPGVLAVVDGRDLAANPELRVYSGETRADQPLLAVDRVRYVGEPVALVIAETTAAADEGGRRVDVDIDDLPHIVDAEDAGASSAPQLHDAWPDNDCGRWTLVHGDAESAMSTAAHVHAATYRSPTQSHVAMEPHAATAAWLPDGSLEVWSGSQSPYVVRNRLATIFGLEPERVRVRGDALGGGFGSKLDLKLEGMVAVAAQVAGRPVRMELRRDEVFMSTAKHAAAVHMQTGVDRGGLIVARIIDITWNAGAYALSTPRASRTGMMRSPGPYRIPHVLARSVARYTNTVPTGPFRGAMTGQVCWAHESALDEIAAELGIDPFELRRRNLLRDGDTFASGDVLHDMHYVELLDTVRDELGASPSRRTRRTLTGRGFGAVVKTTRTPSRSEAHVEVDDRGTVTVRTSSVEMGQGSAASLAQLAAARLSMDAAQVRVSLPDTSSTPFDQTTSSSRTTFAMGLAVEDAATDLRRRIEVAARGVFGDLDDEVLHEDGCLVDPRDPGRRFDYAKVVATSGVTSLVGHGVYQSPEGAGRLDDVTSQGNLSVHFHQGVVGVDVEVDVDTGAVRVLRAHGATYAGRLVDETRARKQTTGGIVFGLGQALMEEVQFEDGQLSNPNLSDYQIPSIVDVPDVGATILDDPDPAAEPHGIGESTVPPTAPAIANAIQAATGVRIRDLPITAEKVLRALEEGNTDDVAR